MKYHETQKRILQNDILIEMINHYLNVMEKEATTQKQHGGGNGQEAPAPPKKGQV